MAATQSNAVLSDEDDYENEDDTPSSSSSLTSTSSSSSTTTTEITKFLYPFDARYIENRISQLLLPKMKSANMKLVRKKGNFSFDVVSFSIQPTAAHQAWTGTNPRKGGEVYGMALARNNPIELEEDLILLTHNLFQHIMYLTPVYDDDKVSEIVYEGPYVNVNIRESCAYVSFYHTFIIDESRPHLKLTFTMVEHTADEYKQKYGV
jgi:hypothetical protein